MLKYIVKRVLLLIPTMLCVAFIVFSLMELTPGSPEVIILGEGATEEAYQEVREEYGLDRPFLTRFVDYIVGVFQGDLGTSWRTGRSVASELSVRFANTLKLAIVSMIVAIAIGVPLGIISAVKQQSAVDIACTASAIAFSSLMCMSIPYV